MEGGGRGKETKAYLRQGMEVFLSKIKDACREQNWHWNLVVCGPRNEAYKRFQQARKKGEAGIVALLVDLEDPVPVNVEPIAHLTARDPWNFDGVDGDAIHLMVQTMETWIVADPGALRKYYGQGFRENDLPRRQNLEEESKRDIEKALEQATKWTQKRAYRKIHHARELLQRIDPMTVQERCSHCKQFFVKILDLIKRHSVKPAC